MLKVQHVSENRQAVCENFHVIKQWTPKYYIFLFISPMYMYSHMYTHMY